MKVLERSLNGVILFQDTTFSDDRGMFLETYNQRSFDELVGYEVRFVQDNESISHRNVLRGLHFQRPPYTQGKLVRVVHGSIIDVVVDMRSDSETFGQHAVFELDDKGKKKLWIPEGFAHGFLSLSDHTVFNYKCTNFYHGPSEETLLWNDPALGIDWNAQDPIISDKDLVGKEFNLLNSIF